MADTPVNNPADEWVPVNNSAPLDEWVPVNTGKLLANSPDDNTLTSLAKGAGTVGLYGVANAVGGFSGNLNEFAHQTVDHAEAGVKTLAGSLFPDALPQWNKGYGDNLADTQTARENNPYLQKLDQLNPTSQTIATGLARGLGTGQYVPTTKMGEIAMGAGEGAVSMIAPGAGGLGEAWLGKAPLAAGAAMGTTGTLAQQAGMDPYFASLTGMAVPGAIGKAADLAAPIFSKEAAARAAEDRLQKTATDPQQALKTAETQPDIGAPLNLAEATQDPGIASMQKQLQQQTVGEHGNISPVATALQDIANEQNTARTNLLNSSVAPDADVRAPSDLFQQMKAEAELHADIANLWTPTAGEPKETGQALREHLAGENKSAGDMIDALYDKVRSSDPNGEFHIFTQPAARAAQALKESFDPDVETPSPIADPIIEKVANLPDVMPMDRLMKMDTTVTNAMAASLRAAQQGQDGARAGYAKLVELKQSIMDAINSAIDAQDNLDNMNVKSGKMAPGDTLGAKLNDLDRQFNAGAAAQGNTGQAASVSQGTDGQLYGGTSSFSQRSGNPGSSSTMAGDAVAGGEAPVAKPTIYRESGTGKFKAIPKNSVKPQTLDMLQAAKELHAARAQTFREGPVGDVLATNGFKGQYLMPESEIPSKAFVQKDKGYQTAQAFLHAGANDPTVVSAMQDFALSRLRNGDEPVTQKSLDAWKEKYLGALRAIDEHAPGFSSSFNHVAAVNEAAMAAGQGIPGKFIGFTDPDEAVKTIGGMVRANDGPTRLRNLLKAVQNDPKAEGGIRAAVIEDLKDHGMVRGEFSYPKLQNYINAHGASLEAVFGKDSVEMNNIEKLTQSLKISDDALKAAETKGTSYTPRGLTNQFVKLGKAINDRGGKTIASVIALSAVEGLMSGNMLHLGAAVGGAALTHFADAMRLRGIRSVNDLYFTAFEDPQVGLAMLQRAVDRNGLPQPKLVRFALNQLSNMLIQSRVEGVEKKDRPAFASGGAPSSWTPDHERLTNRLMDLAEKAKKGLAQASEPLLTVPDTVVARALEVAGKSI